MSHPGGILGELFSPSETANAVGVSRKQNQNIITCPHLHPHAYAYTNAKFVVKMSTRAKALVTSSQLDFSESGRPPKATF